jgi:hypothetical protein
MSRPAMISKREVKEDVLAEKMAVVQAAVERFLETYNVVFFGGAERVSFEPL